MGASSIFPKLAKNILSKMNWKERNEFDFDLEKGQTEKGRDYIAISVLQRNLHLMENDHKLTISGKKRSKFCAKFCNKMEKAFTCFFPSFFDAF